MTGEAGLLTHTLREGVTISEAHLAECGECGRSFASRNLAAVLTWATEHDTEGCDHEAWEKERGVGTGEVAVTPRFDGQVQR